MKILSVKAHSREYEIVIEKDFSQLGAKIKEVFHGKLLVVYDKNTYPLFSSDIKNQLSYLELLEVVLPAGEDTKNIQSYIKLPS